MKNGIQTRVFRSHCRTFLESSALEKVKLSACLVFVFFATVVFLVFVAKEVFSFSPQLFVSTVSLPLGAAYFCMKMWSVQLVFSHRYLTYTAQHNQQSNSAQWRCNSGSGSCDAPQHWGRGFCSIFRQDNLLFKSIGCHLIQKIIQWRKRTVSFRFRTILTWPWMTRFQYKNNMRILNPCL